MTSHALSRRKPSNAKALKALDRAMYDHHLAVRYKVAAEVMQPGSKEQTRLTTLMRHHENASWNGFLVVRRALGVDPDADEPQPKRHWDAGT